MTFSIHERNSGLGEYGKFHYVRKVIQYSIMVDREMGVCNGQAGSKV